MTSVLPMALAVLALGCRQPVEAPTELDDLATFLFRGFEDEDTAGLEAGITNLRPLLVDAPEEGWSLAAPSLEDLADLVPPEGRDPADCGGLAVVHDSPYAVGEHVAIMLLSDLTPVSPTAERYDRSFLEGEGCFPDAACAFLRTENAIVRDNALMHMEFTLFEDYRWVGDAILSRNWLEVSAHGDGDANHLWQDWELEAWVPGDDGGTLRLWAMWTEAEYAGVSEELAEISGRAALSRAMEVQDEWLEQAR